ncbi:MAG TPA: cyanophycin synthetase [Negativicutes bacterium]
MQILKIHMLEGPNVYSHHPVLRIRLNIGHYEGVDSNTITGFNTRLLQVLPGLKEHHCSLGRPGGFEKRLSEGTYLAHIFEHVVLELQCLVGDCVNFGQTRSSGQYGIYDVVIGYRRAAVALQAIEVGIGLLNAIVKQSPVDIQCQVQAIQDAGKADELGPSTAAIYQVAQDRKIPVTLLGDNLLVLGQGCHCQRVWATLTGRTSAVAVDLASDKYLTKKILEDSGIPVPYGRVVNSAAAADKAFAAMGGMVVIKPLTGNQGKGVATIASAVEVEQAFQVASQYDSNVLIEEFIPGRQYRLCVIDGKMVAAAERIPAYVVGDGRHTVTELVEAVNSHPERGDGHEKPLTKMQIDDLTISVLAKQNLSPQIVPVAKQVVYIRDNANLSTGGTAVDMTDIVHADHIHLAERSACLIGLDVAGIDLVAVDITAPVTQGNGVVIEVNAAPGIRMHHFPSAGKPRNVAGHIIDYLFPENSNGRIWLFAITGTNGKTTVTRLISHIWQLAGYKVGMTNTDGIYIDGHCLLAGDTTGPDSAKIVLRDPRVEVAVLETARGGILRGGLGFDQCDVGIVTNITEDHLGQDGIENLDDLSHIKSLVPETVRSGGFALLNADDPYVAAMAIRIQAEVVYFSLEPDNIIVRRHLGVGGKAFFVKEGMLYAACGGLSRSISRVGDIPVTLGGIALHNLQNALIAAAACYCSKIPIHFIRQGLFTFAENPGRLTLLNVGAFRVCVDYGHNPAGYQALIRTVTKLGASRLIGVIGAPGDRRDDVTIHIGHIAGQGFDAIYIKEDGDLRGRLPGETASLLKQGVMEAGFSLTQIVTILSEAEAVRSALEAAKAGDLVVIFYEKYDLVMDVIRQFRENSLPKVAAVDYSLCHQVVAGV